jgi:hypothetical protein
MKKHWLLRALKIGVLILLAAGLFSLLVMWLWNHLMPAVFGLHTITYWQALGLLVLSKILLGGHHGRPGFAMHWRRRMMDRWEQMSPEERERFRAGMCGGHGPWAPPTGAPKA